MNNKVAIALFGTALMAQASGARAEVSANPNELAGSDTFNQVMDDLLPAVLTLGNGAGIETYLGCGSSCGERQLIGNPKTAEGEPACTDDNGGENSGCQEISPMSRAMGSGICAAGNSEAAGNAEGLAVCRDGIVIVTDNASLGQYGDSAATCNSYAALANTDNAGPPSPNFPDRGVGVFRNNGALATTGYVIGANLAAGDEWMDVVRVIYTGCENDDGMCATAIPRTQRCNSAVRRELLSSWANLFEGVDCGAAGDACGVDATPTDGNVDTGLRHAFRRDDASGTTDVFLELIEVNANLAGRAKVTATLTEAGAAGGCSPGASPANRVLITPIPENFAFCDGGMDENWHPDCHNSVITPLGGDPIRKDCKAEDDLCGYDKKAPVVQAIRSTRGDNPYPTHQCTRGNFAKQNYLNSPYGVCPDGTVPSAGQCRIPYFNDTTAGTRNFNCINPINSTHSSIPLAYDGRVFNHVMRSPAGEVAQFVVGAKPEVASWRMNMVQIVTSGAQNLFGKAYAAGEYVCTEDDATRNIGCIVGRTTCTVGFAGREAAYTTANDSHLTNEPVQLQDALPSDAQISAYTYPFARELYLNAVGGFENITADCQARGDAQAYCDDQLEIANEFFNTGTSGNVMAGLCQDAGFIPLPAAQCVGATGTAGCGAPSVQALAACTPN